jgi:hypothetical protein
MSRKPAGNRAVRQSRNRTLALICNLPHTVVTVPRYGRQKLAKTLRNVVNEPYRFEIGVSQGRVHNPAEVTAAAET